MKKPRGRLKKILSSLLKRKPRVHLEKYLSSRRTDLKRIPKNMYPKSLTSLKKMKKTKLLRLPLKIRMPFWTICSNTILNL